MLSFGVCISQSAVIIISILTATLKQCSFRERELRVGWKWNSLDIILHIAKLHLLMDEYLIFRILGFLFLQVTAFCSLQELAWKVWLCDACRFWLKFCYFRGGKAVGWGEAGKRSVHARMGTHAFVKLCRLA